MKAMPSQRTLAQKIPRGFGEAARLRFYMGLANELAAKVGRVSAFVNHRLSIGAYHEEVLKAVMRPMLPDRFSFRTGFVFHPDNGASQQGDILIVDEMHPAAYFFREGNFAIVHQAALVCVIEVKTHLTKTTFKEALSCLASYRNTTTKPHHPSTLLFAFSSSSFSARRLDEWYKSAQLSDDFLNYPLCIFALNQGMIQLRHTPKDCDWGHYVCIGESVRGPKLKNLSWFLQTIRKCALSHAKFDENPFTLALPEGLWWSKQFWRLGTGFHEPSASSAASDAEPNRS